MKNNKRIFLHAVRMIIVNFRNYIMLSIITSISFIIVLFFLVSLDTNSYNDNKRILSIPSNIAQLSMNHSNQNYVSMMMNYIKGMDNTSVASWKMTTAQLDAYNTSSLIINTQLLFFSYDQLDIPFHDGNGFTSINLIKGQKFTYQDTVEASNVVIVGSMFASHYYTDVLGSVIKIPVSINGEKIVKDYLVVGIFDDSHSSALVNDSSYHDVNVMYTSFILPITQSEYFDDDNMDVFNVIVSDHIEDIQEQSWELGANLLTTINQRAAVYETLYQNSFIKGIVLLMAFIILGLSSYSNTTNSIQNRKQEIGFKLGLGIERIDIFKEFLIEAFIVLMVNVIIAIFVVISISSGIVLWIRLFVDDSYLLYISLFSLVQFSIFTVFIVSISCAILANQAMRIDALEHIRSS